MTQSLSGVWICNYSEMNEHLGHNYQRTFFEKCDHLMAKDGLIVLQVNVTDALVTYSQHYLSASNVIVFCDLCSVMVFCDVVLKTNRGLVIHICAGI